MKTKQPKKRGRKPSGQKYIITSIVMDENLRAYMDLFILKHCPATSRSAFIRSAVEEYIKRRGM